MNLAVRNVVSRFLEFLGFEMALAGDGIEALSVFIEGSFDLVAIQALINGGTVHAVLPEEVPDQTLLAAVLHY